MQRVVLPVLILFVSTGVAEEPRAVLERAVTAMGLHTDPAKRPGILLRFRGQLADHFRAEGTIHYGNHGGRRLVMSTEEKDAQKSNVYVVLSAKGGFIFSAHGIPDLPPDVLPSYRTMEMLFSPFALLSLLEAKDVILKELDDIKIDGKPARRIRVAIAKETAHLDFDKQSGLLVRAVVKWGDIEVTSNFQDYGDHTKTLDQRTLKAAGFGEAGHIACLQQRARGRNSLEEAIALTSQLSDEDRNKRDSAAADLIRLGKSALPAVRLALRDRDADVVRRARQILDVLEKLDEPALLRAAIRQAVYSRTKRSVPALLALILHATPEELIHIRAALFALQESDGQLEPTLVRALDDPDPKVRTVAEFIHGKDHELLARQPGRPIFPRDIRLPARVRAQFGTDAAVDFEFVELQFFNASDPRAFQKP